MCAARCQVLQGLKHSIDGMVSMEMPPPKFIPTRVRSRSLARVQREPAAMQIRILKHQKERFEHWIRCACCDRILKWQRTSIKQIQNPL